jgi:hypothetical protein
VLEELADFRFCQFVNSVSDLHDKSCDGIFTGGRKFSGRQCNDASASLKTLIPPIGAQNEFSALAALTSSLLQIFSVVNDEGKVIHETSAGAPLRSPVKG